MCVAYAEIPLRNSSYVSFCFFMGILSLHTTRKETRSFKHALVHNA